MSTLNQVGMGRNEIKVILKHVDLILAISDLLETSKFEIIKEHAYGHQDNLKRILTQLEQLNFRMDTESKKCTSIYQ